jgi:hypothetical protein
MLNFNLTLQEALNNIHFTEKFLEFNIHEEERERCDHTDKELIERYGDAKWKVIDTLNQQYNTILASEFDLYNWLYHKENDDVAYFLNEVGSNCLNHSQFKAPHAFRIWFGSKGFILGIQQKGRGFNAKKVHVEKIRENEGAAFDFFRNCKNKIFFDNPKESKIIFMEFMF